jgi:hypothetical protein
MQPCGCKRNPGRPHSSAQGSRNLSPPSNVPNATPQMFARQSEIVLSVGGTGYGLSRSSERTGHPLRREEGLPTFTLEKLVPGGIAEVSSWLGRANEEQGASGCRRGSSPRADPISL